MEDTALVQRFKEQGDRRAFEEIISKYENRIFRFGFRMCGQLQDAEDVVQDTFVSAYRYLKDFRGEASLLSWLLKIASSVCIKKRRLKKDEPRNHLSLEHMQEEGNADSEVHGDEKLSPASLVLDNEMREMIQGLLDDIPEHYRIVIVLRDMEGLSTREVAEALDISESAAKVRLHRARAMLFKRFTEVTDEGQRIEAEGTGVQ